MKLTPMADHPEIVIDTERHPLMERVNRGDVVLARDVLSGRDRRRRRHQVEAPRERDRASEHLADLRDMAVEANRTMAAKGLAYRFVVSCDDGDLFITVNRLTADGREVALQRVNITHSEFPDLVRKIEAGEGIFLEVVG